MEEGSQVATRDNPRVPDETSILLSPSVRRQPMTYFMYPGLDAPNLKGFLLENQASSACIQKAMDDIGRFTPCPSIQNMSDLADNMSSTISDEVFIEDVIEVADDTVIYNSTADDTLLDEVPLETTVNEADGTVQNSDCDNKLSPKMEANGGISDKKRRKGLSKFFVSLCTCGGLKSSKHKNFGSPTSTTEL